MRKFVIGIAIVGIFIVYSIGIRHQRPVIAKPAALAKGSSSSSNSAGSQTASTSAGSSTGSSTTGGSQTTTSSSTHNYWKGSKHEFRTFNFRLLLS